MEQARWGWTRRYQQAQPGSAELPTHQCPRRHLQGCSCSPSLLRTEYVCNTCCWMTKHTQHMWAISMYTHQLIHSHHVRKCAHTHTTSLAVCMKLYNISYLHAAAPMVSFMNGVVCLSPPGASPFGKIGLWDQACGLCPFLPMFPRAGNCLSGLHSLICKLGLITRNH